MATSILYGQRGGAPQHPSDSPPVEARNPSPIPDIAREVTPGPKINAENLSAARLGDSDGVEGDLAVATGNPLRLTWQRSFFALFFVIYLLWRKIAEEGNRL
ncbi:hypothetical protein L1766_04675 [Thermovorax subterraneus]|nr:hypothetical protein [Thermovorax subterraneus]